MSKLHNTLKAIVDSRINSYKFGMEKNQVEIESTLEKGTGPSFYDASQVAHKSMMMVAHRQTVNELERLWDAFEDELVKNEIPETGEFDAYDLLLIDIALTAQRDALFEMNRGEMSPERQEELDRRQNYLMDLLARVKQARYHS